MFLKLYILSKLFNKAARQSKSPTENNEKLTLSTPGLNRLNKLYKDYSDLKVFLKLQAFKTSPIRKTKNPF
jgi:hypothetical protein